jgi:phosphate uptake regulator
VRETRKLQQVGGGTYTVSIPKEWATERGLSAGTEVALYGHDDGSLVLRRPEDDADAVATRRVDVDGLEDRKLRRALRAAYAVGSDTVVLAAGESLTRAQRRAVDEERGRLPGLERVDETGEELTFRCVLDAADVSVPQSVAQLQFVALSTHRAATDRLTDGGAGSASPERRGEDLDRLLALVTRQLNRSLTNFETLHALETTRPELFDHYRTARNLRRVGAHAARIASVARRADGAVPDGVDEDLRAAAAASRSVVETATDAVLTVPTPSATDAHAALEEWASAIDRLDAVESALLDARTTGAHVLVPGALCRTAERGRDIAGVALEARLRSSPPRRPAGPPGAGAGDRDGS